LRIELAKAILCDKPNQQTNTVIDRRDWNASIGDFDDDYQTVSRHNALAAALEEYGMPMNFDLDGGSTQNMGSVESATSIDDCLDPSLARLDWMNSNGESPVTPSNGPLPSTDTSPLSPSDIDNYIMSPASHHLSLSSSSSNSPPFLLASSLSTSSSSSSTALTGTLGSLPTPVSDWSKEGTEHDAGGPNISSRSPTALLEETSSPLYTAISLGNMDMARLLISSGAKLDVPDRNGDTLLHHCVRRGDIVLSSALLDLGANVLHTTAGGRTPLHLAVSTGNEAMVAMLLDWCSNEKDIISTANSAKPTTNITRQKTAVSKPSLLGHFIDACDANNMTALHLSVKLQRIEVLKVLLEYGASVN
jgi:hypothetical protein